jgi:hypothetical protein
MRTQPETKCVVQAWVDRDFRERFAELARQSERSMAAEARLALKRHLESAKRARTAA